MPQNKPLNVKFDAKFWAKEVVNRFQNLPTHEQLKIQFSELDLTAFVINTLRQKGLNTDANQQAVMKELQESQLIPTT